MAHLRIVEDIPKPRFRLSASGSLWVYRWPDGSTAVAEPKYLRELVEHVWGKICLMRKEWVYG